jgi:glycosyltransferase involved in cell wall biosynthesis
MMNTPSFFEVVTAPYYLVIGNYNQKFAGVRAMYYLCHALNQLGQEAYILGADEEVTHLRCPILKPSDFKRHQKSKYAPITVYPEVVSGNPYGMPNVVRFLLNKAGLLGGDNEFPETELVYAYTADYIPDGTALPLLTIPVVDHSIFHNNNNPFDNQRTGKAYYANKYLVHGGQLTEHVDGAISLCQDVNLTPNQIADILRKCELLYCYEPSAIIGEALLCGCPVVIIPSTYLDENLSYPIAGEGIASTDSEEDIAYAKRTISICQENNVQFHGHCWFHVNQFIKATQEKFTKAESQDKVRQLNWGMEIVEYFKQISPVTTKDINLQKFDSVRWLNQNVLTEGDAVMMAERMHHHWLYRPTFHLIITLNSNELPFLSDTFDSLQQQLYGAWGLSIISAEAKPDFLADLPENIEWITLETSLNETINQTVNEAGLDWVMQLMPGDTLDPHALWSFADSINANNEYRFIYSDERQPNEQPELLFKPDFNLELLRSSSYIGRSAIIRRDSFEEIGGYTGLAYVDIIDLAFHVYETWGGNAIGHIADVLYSSAHIECDEETLKENELAVRVAHINRQGINARVLHLPSHTFQTKYFYDEAPLISVVIANKNNASSCYAAVNSLLNDTKYPNYEVLLIDQMSDIEDMPFIYEDFKESYGDRLHILPFDKANYSAAINFGVAKAKGDYVLIMSSLTMPVNNEWMSELVSLAQYTDSGVIGLKSVDENEPHNVIHAGGVLGISNDVIGLSLGQSYDDSGYMYRTQIAQEYDFVSSSAFMISKEKFNMAGGLDEGALSNTHFCVTDFCLNVKKLGYRNIWTPHAVVKQNLGLSLQSNGLSDYDNDGAEDVLISRWPEFIVKGNGYNRNLSLSSSDFSIQTRFHVGWKECDEHIPRIMAFPFSKGAIGEFRTRSPLNNLFYDGRVEISMLPNHQNMVSSFIPSKFEVIRAQPDTIYLNNALQDEHYEFLKWVKNHLDVFVVFSLDDLIISLPKRNDAKRLLHKDIRHRLRRVLGMCDRLIVSTEPLAHAFKEYCKDIVVIPNSLDMRRWSQVSLPSYSKREKLRVGWAGGQLHEGDLAIIVDLVKSTSKQVDWVFMGMLPPELKNDIHEYHKFTSFDDYPEKMALLDLDLAIAPLEQHPFNEAKSNLRLLEYGVLGWPVICTDIYPYQTNNPPVERVQNTLISWKQAIESAVQNPDALKMKGKSLQDWVLKHYTIDKYLDAWFSALSKR